MSSPLQSSTANRTHIKDKFPVSDLEGLTKRLVRSASSDNHPIVCYLKSEVENRCGLNIMYSCIELAGVCRFFVCLFVWLVGFADRALEVWGSWHVLERELHKRKVFNEEADRRRQGLSSLITYLKKVNKDQSRKVQDAEVGGCVVGVVWACLCNTGRISSC